MSIRFTQFMLPNGRQKPVTISRSQGIEAKADEVVARGGSFEIEVLSTGVVSITCEDHAAEATISHHLCENGPEVPKTVDKVVEEAYWHYSNSPKKRNQ